MMVDLECMLPLNQSLKTKTRGLCGTFNKIQSDDFKTPEGVVNTNPSAFGNSWKMDSLCKEVVDQKHPCEVQIQKAPVADKKCNKLKLSPFSACHHVVSPDKYIYACRYDVCGCTNGINCLCNAIAAYTKECAEQGVVIEWRNNNILPECGMYCSYSFYCLSHLTIYFGRDVFVTPY